ncbi:pimeloyl-ACP methyl ester carboxylesterase [Acetoanaerobium pronyense]|uniref:Pimeloyl-ACP methyl ester carboxylesterase n=1 Tax=Acetoanaerobium pronyense TaxID=1482736 RepID=A0ABS4KMZ6_9FIRM|nr:alpha/beta fold hydrolase [Acetoanaerobium pronyense]MBP2028596.1 pimeloyl-ACP methyl ester carboxylesterase [Acetoanaerobium pronyense]
MDRFDFPVGYYNLHKIKIIEFQLNRWHSFGYARLEDMVEAGKRINTADDWKEEMIRQAEKALAEGRTMNGAFYYRAAEFFTLPSDPDKLKLYDKFIDLFYNNVFANDDIERVLVPYEDGYLSSMKVPSRMDTTKGQIVIHGGFDSFIEEFYSMAVYFSNLGYEVIMFEGPGQGATLKKYNLPLTHEWEKPIKAILDYFNLDDVTLIGISMGGWLCLRASAFEPRIKRVIASSIAFDYMQIPPKFIASFARFLFKYPKLMNYLAELKMKKMPQEKWGIYNLMYITKKDTPLDASKMILELSEENLHSDLVKQDVLILTGEEDHFIPLKMHHKQVKALTNAKSITERIFTRDDQGHNHCQIGNFGLALDVMAKWIKNHSK